MAMSTSNPLSGQREHTLSSSQPVKSILRTITSSNSSLGARKRSAEDNESIPSSPTKRRKSVHFNMDLNIITEIGKRTLEITKREVKKALDDHLRGEDEYYNELIDIFSSDRQGYVPSANGSDTIVQPQDLIYYVISLSAFAPTITKSCQGLIKAVLSVAWLGRDESFAKAYSQFLAAIISARGPCMDPVLNMVLDKFNFSRPSEWSAHDFPDVDRETMQNRLHSCLHFILQMFPTATSVFKNLMARKFPHEDESKSVHRMFVDNLLRLYKQWRGHSSQLDLEIMELITDRTVKMDVLFQFDMSQLDDDMVPRIMQKVNAEDEDDEDDADSILSDDPDEDEEEMKIEKIAGYIAKLDSNLDRLFALYAPSFVNPGSAEAKGNFEDLLSDFTNIVLKHWKSRHTQFLVFHFAQKSDEFRDRFIGSLLTIMQSNRPQPERQAAVAYLSSFAARGSHVPADSVRTIATILCKTIEKFRQDHEAGCRGPDLRKYKQLYASFQALIYLYCYRWRDLVDNYPDIVDPDDVASYLGQELTWMFGLQSTLKNIIYSPFNPLKVCDPAITNEFAKLANSLKCVWVFGKIEQNKNVNLMQYASGNYSNGGALRETGLNSTDESWHQLEATFPFDPYQLPVSKRWLEGDYLPWTPIPGLQGPEDDDDDSDDDEDDDVDSDMDEDDDMTEATDEERARR